MIWFTIAHIFATLLDLIQIGRLSPTEQELELLILHHQLDILERRQKKPIRPSRVERLTLAVLAKKLKEVSSRSTRQLNTVIRIFQPETILRWHHALVRCKWTYKKNKGGRPRIGQTTKDLVIHLAKENINWGYGKIEGELLKLGIIVSLTSIRNILNRNDIVPAPVRNGSIGWRKLMSHYKKQILACDFFTVETVWLKTLYVFFFSAPHGGVSDCAKCATG